MSMSPLSLVFLSAVHQDILLLPPSKYMWPLAPYLSPPPLTPGSSKPPHPHLNDHHCFPSQPQPPFLATENLFAMPNQTDLSKISLPPTSPPKSPHVAQSNTEIFPMACRPPPNPPTPTPQVRDPPAAHSTPDRALPCRSSYTAAGSDLGPSHWLVPQQNSPSG